MQAVAEQDLKKRLTMHMQQLIGQLSVAIRARPNGAAAIQRSSFVTAAVVCWPVCSQCSVPQPIAASKQFSRIPWELPAALFSRPKEPLQWSRPQHLRFRSLFFVPRPSPRGFVAPRSPSRASPMAPSGVGPNVSPPLRNLAPAQPIVMEPLLHQPRMVAMVRSRVDPAVAGRFRLSTHLSHALQSRRHLSSSAHTLSSVRKLAAPRQPLGVRHGDGSNHALHVPPSHSQTHSGLLRLIRARCPLRHRPSQD
jgi:hypothetical protein